MPWKDEGIGIAHVARVDGKLPGLYVIRTSETGERSFYYWRENAAARMLLDLPQTDAMLAALASYDLIYLSGVTLSLYSPDGRQQLSMRSGKLAKARRASHSTPISVCKAGRFWIPRVRSIATFLPSRTSFWRLSMTSLHCSEHACTAN